jgi:hypothetical protein
MRIGGTARRPVALRQYAVRPAATSDQYEYQAQPGVFPLGQLERVRSSPDVAEATPLYFGAKEICGRTFL